jgi:hypothetical protein
MSCCANLSMMLRETVGANRVTRQQGICCEGTDADPFRPEVNFASGDVLPSCPNVDVFCPIVRVSLTCVAFIAGTP